MANDTKLGPPQAGGPKPVVKYALVAGGLILAYILYKKYAGSSSSTLGSGTTGTTTGTSSIDPNTGLPTSSYAVDPVTGVPINPSTGQDFGQIGSASGSLSQWITSATTAGNTLGIDPGLVSQALYNYTNGLSLSNAQGGILDKIFGSVGAAPGNALPFNPAPASSTSTSTGSTAGTSTNKTISAVQQFVNNVYANMHNPLTAKNVNPANAALAEADVKKGLAALPVGYTAPAGYVLNPSTRILTKKAA